MTKVIGTHYKKRKHKLALKGKVIFVCNIAKFLITYNPIKFNFLN